MQLLHTMLRVGDMQRSIDFYTKVVGMDLLRTTERPTRGIHLPSSPSTAATKTARPNWS